MSDRLKILLSIWVCPAITGDELRKDMGSLVTKEITNILEEKLVELAPSTSNFDLRPTGFQLTRDGRRELAGQLRSLVDSVEY